MESVSAVAPVGDAGEAAQPLLQVVDVTKHFALRSQRIGVRRPVVHALDSVSLGVKRGETLAIVGESGCGKSTLARLITGLVTPDAGTVVVDGIDMRSLRRQPRKRARYVQMVFQNPASSLNRSWKVRDIVAEPLRLLSTKSRSEVVARVGELLEIVGLTKAAANRYPHQFSGGQGQRIAIARALAISPSVVVLDEAVSALDVSVQAQILNLLVDLRASMKLTYVFISHDLAVTRHIAERVAVLYLGKVVETGPTESIFRHPRHPYTRALISSMPTTGDPEAGSSPVILSGEVPRATDPPSGCRFRTRCWKATERCASEAPVLRSDDRGDDFYACHHPE